MVYVVHGVAKSQTQLSNFHFISGEITGEYFHKLGVKKIFFNKRHKTLIINGKAESLDFEIKNFYSYKMEKAMASHSSTLAWKIPWAEEPGRLESMGSLRVGHD